MYGTWFGTTFIGVFALAALIALVVAASPLFAVLFVLLALGFIASLVVFRRGQQARAGGPGQSGASTAAGGTAGAGGQAPIPRSGGEPVSGEGHSRGGETAGQRASGRH